MVEGPRRESQRAKRAGGREAATRPIVGDGVGVGGGARPRAAADGPRAGAGARAPVVPLYVVEVVARGLRLSARARLDGAFRASYCASVRSPPTDNLTGRPVLRHVPRARRRHRAAGFFGEVRPVDALDEGPMAPPVAPAQPTMMMMETETAPLLFVEAATADGVWTVRSSDGVVGHIFRVDAKYAYFAGRFNGLTATFREPSLERLKERIVASSR